MKEHNLGDELAQQNLHGYDVMCLVNLLNSLFALICCTHMWRQQAIVIESSYISRTFQWLVVHSIVVLWVLWMVKHCLSPTYLFLAPRIANTTILYSRKVLKTFHPYLNHKHKFTTITGKTTPLLLIQYMEVWHSLPHYVHLMLPIAFSQNISCQMHFW